MFSKILVALDHENTSVSLFERSVTLAQATGASLMLLRVLTPEGDDTLTLPAYSGLVYHPLGTNDSIWDVYHERYREYEAQGLEILQSLTQQAIDAGVNTEFTQIPGNPGRSICELAKTWSADLVMVGSHGRKGLSEMLLGSVSNYVMHHATCSVLVVHDPPESGVEEQAEAEADLAAVEG